jgi:glucose/arabinose dehydrogenase
MLGLAVDPQFASNRYVYTFQSHRASNGAMDNRVVRWTVDAGWTALGNRTDIVTGIPWGNGGAHSGGRIRFGTDGHLYVTSGDNRMGPIPQDLQGLGSKVLRVTRDGAAAAGNGTFPRPADPRIFGYGFRNPQGLAVRANGQVFTCEHGPVHRDEVTLLAPGGNGGWDPMNPGDPTYRGYEGQWPMSDSVKFPAVLRPTWTTGGVSEGMAGCGFVSGAAWRGWDGALVVGLLAGRRVQVLRLSDDGRAVLLSARALEFGDRIRGVTQGPDGALYVATDGKTGGDEIWRVAPRP